MPSPLLSATGRIFGGEGRRQHSARSPGGRGGHRGCITLPALPPVAPSTGGGDTGVLRSQPEVVTFTPAPPPPTAASPATDVLSDTAFEEWLELERLDIPAQQDNHRSQSRRHGVIPAVTRSAARTQQGVGDQPGAFAVLFAKESIGAAIATSAAPHSDSLELSTCPACDLETPDTYAQAHAGPHSKIWRAAEDKEFGGLRAVGTFKELGGT